MYTKYWEMMKAHRKYNTQRPLHIGTFFFAPQELVWRVCPICPEAQDVVVQLENAWKNRRFYI